MTHDFFEGAQQAFSLYYIDLFESSPKDGTPRYGDIIPHLIETHLNIPEKAAKKLIPHGIVTEVQWEQDANSYQSHFRTRKWFVQESADSQKTLQWALGEKHPFDLPIPQETDSSDAFEKYNERTLEGIQHILGQAQTLITDFFISNPASTEMQNQFSESIRNARREFRQSTRQAFQEKSYWNALTNKIGSIV